MSVSYYIVLDKEDVDFDTFVNGKSSAIAASSRERFLLSTLARSRIDCAIFWMSLASPCSSLWVISRYHSSCEIER